MNGVSDFDNKNPLHIFRLYGGVGSVAHGKWTYYHGAIYLEYTSHDGSKRRVKVRGSRNEYRSRKKAYNDLPDVLKDNALYYESIQTALKELENAPRVYYKAMRVVNGQLRSVYLPQVVYRLNQIYTQPVIPSWHIGIYVHDSEENARKYANEQMMKNGGEYAVVEVETSKPIMLKNGKIAVVAMRPTRVIGDVMRLSDAVAVSSANKAFYTIKKWDPEDSVWKDVGRRHELNDEVIAEHSYRSWKYFYLSQ